MLQRRNGCSYSPVSLLVQLLSINRPFVLTWFLILYFLFYILLLLFLLTEGMRSSQMCQRSDWWGKRENCPSFKAEQKKNRRKEIQKDRTRKIILHSASALPAKCTNFLAEASPLSRYKKKIKKRARKDKDVRETIESKRPSAKGDFLPSWSKTRTS